MVYGKSSSQKALSYRHSLSKFFIVHGKTLKAVRKAISVVTLVSLLGGVTYYEINKYVDLVLESKTALTVAQEEDKQCTQSLNKISSTYADCYTMSRDPIIRKIFLEK